MVELLIFLSEPCHVCQLLLTIVHGADDSTFPVTVDVRTGRYLDGLKLVVEVCYITIRVQHFVVFNVVSFLFDV